MPYITEVYPVLVAASHESYRHLRPLHVGDRRRTVASTPEVLVHPGYAATYKRKQRARRQPD